MQFAKSEDVYQTKETLTECEDVRVEDNEAETEDDPDAKIETNRRVQLATKVAVQPAVQYIW